MAFRKFTILLLSLIIPFILGAQSGFTTSGGANFLGYGRCGVNIGGIESIYLNQAGLTGVKNLAVDLSVERRFNLQELTNVSLGLGKSFGFGTFGLMVSSFGFTEYNEQKIGLAYARKLGNNISLGGQLDMLRYNISAVGSKSLATFELGMQLDLNREFSIATHIFSPGKVSVTENTDIGTRFRLGVRYKPSSKVFILAEADKLIYRKTELKLGVSYRLVKQAEVRLGINPVTEFFSFGALFSFKDKYKMASAFALNDRLGTSSALSLQYSN